MRRNIPSPKELLSEAREVFTTPSLSDYTDVIVELREKGMAWRAISEWLTKRGVKCSHNEVYYLGKRRAEAEEEEEYYGYTDNDRPCANVRRKMALEKEQEEQSDKEISQ
jgi:hypothetical protein